MNQLGRTEHPPADVPETDSSGHDMPRWNVRLPESLRLRNSGVMYVLVILVFAFAVLSSVRGQAGYLSPANLGNIADQAAPVGILAVFMTIVLISGNFDLSVASVAALSAVVSLLMVDIAGPLIAITIGLMVSAVLGLTNGLLVQGLGINAFVVTLGMLTAARSLVLIVSGGNSIVPTNRGIADALSGRVGVNFGLVLIIVGVLCLASIVLQVRQRQQINAVKLVVVGALGVFAVAVGAGVYWGSTFVFTTQLIVLIILTMIVSFVLRFTRIGRRLYAVGGNAEAARLAGISVGRYRIVPFILTGLIAGVVGVLYAGRYGAVNPNSLNGQELTVLAAAILGGTSLFGGSGFAGRSVAGALILAILSNGFNILNLGPNYQGLIVGIVIIAAAAVYTVAQRRSQIGT